ncbi:MAG TPA: ABC transporter permease [Candidatus Limnocylindrales bacterium]|nr:ABC transporter permease [Candidatus Limnocylindrales bacterium]
MTSAAPAVPRSASAEPTPVVRFVLDVSAVARAELLKIRHDPVEIVSRASQPLLWLLVFGPVVSRARAIDTGAMPYQDYLTPGVLAQSAQFSAIFFGLAVIWERDLGLIHKLLATPAARSALVLGKALAGSARALVQALIVYIAAIAIGVSVRLDPLSVAVVALVIVLGSSLFATFSLIVACIVRSRERFMGIGQLLTMPLFFASSAIYPVELMPSWLQVIASVNPLTYMVDALRATMIIGGTSQHGVLVDVSVLGAVLVVLLVIGGRLYPRLGQ